MSKEELKSAEAALREIETARASIAKLRQKAERCAALGLMVFAREYDYYAKCLEEKIPLQVKALKGNLPEGFK